MGMTLADRVAQVEDINSFSTGKAAKSTLGVEELRRDVATLRPFESIAAIMVDNPQRARNELRGACRQALADEKWSSFDGAEKAALIEELVDVVFGMGPVDALIEDESITEIIINGIDSIYYERDGVLRKSDSSFESADQVRVLIDRIIAPLGRRIDESSPMVDARLPQGHRVNAVISPIAPDGPLVTIRAFTRHAMTLEELVTLGSMDEQTADFLRWLVVLKKNICVSGGTGSGKTTLLNALSKEIPIHERIVTIEDSLELKFDPDHHVARLEARPKNTEGSGEVTIRQLVINSLRMRPDRIVVGECRGGEALDMLQAMNTGHDGSLTTVHANSAKDVIERMITLVKYAVDLPVDAIEAQLGNAFHYIVQVARDKTGARFLSCISKMVYDPDIRRCSIENIYLRESSASKGCWLESPSLLSEVVDAGIADSEEVELWKSKALGL
jgi:pilus assembly protein CpaF